jgi:bisphosphoglycerate-independent phosphoglycerate mutase (AlkP superfamily)
MDRDVDEEPGIWNQRRDGSVDVPLDAVWEAYVENLEVVLEEVDKLLDDLGGKTVVTADHGNLVGERLSPIPTRRKYGHPYGVHTEELLKVPWFVVDSDDRRNVSSDPPVDLESISDETVDERLDALGYV